MKQGDKCRLSWQENDTVYEFLGVHLGKAQLRNIKLNTIRWSNVEHLIEHKE